MPKPPPAVNTGNAVFCAVSLASSVVVIAHAVAHRARGVGRHQRLAAQDAVLIGKRQPHHFEPVLLDQPLGPRRGLELLVVPQPVALDEGSGGALLR